MKKFILGILISASALSAGAQTFTVEADTVKGSIYGDLNLIDQITNTSSSSMKLTWKIMDNDFPASWSTENVLGICDNNYCRNNTNNQLFMQSFTSADYTPN